MTATVNAPPADVAPATDERPKHRTWCDVDHCKGTREHTSEQFRLDRATPLLVEVFQGADDEAPRLSILEPYSLTSVTMPIADVGPLVAVLAHLAEGALVGTKLDPPGCERVDMDNPPEYSDYYVTNPKQQDGEPSVRR